jgi:5,10-methenyltetrahydromethanopterin hydrogenase
MKNFRWYHVFWWYDRGSLANIPAKISKNICTMISITILLFTLLLSKLAKAVDVLGNPVTYPTISADNIVMFNRTSSGSYVLLTRVVF